MKIRDKKTGIVLTNEHDLLSDVSNVRMGNKYVTAYWFCSLEDLYLLDTADEDLRAKLMQTVYSNEIDTEDEPNPAAQFREKF